MSDLDDRRRSILAALQAQANDAFDADGKSEGELSQRDKRKAAASTRGNRQKFVDGPPDDAMSAPGGEGFGETPRRRGAGHRQSLAAPAALPKLPDERRIEFSMLPQRRIKKTRGTLISFLICVGIPFVLAAVYYFGYASNQYVVEFHFAVRQSSQNTASPVIAGNVAAQLGVATAANSTENYMVTDYLMSRQIIDEMQSRIKLTTLYSRPEVDWWARFNPNRPIEWFLRYWKSMASASYDQITGIAVAQVRAFTPDDAFLVATTMVTLAENLVNEVGLRPRRDAVKFAETEVKRAEDRLVAIRTNLATYRDKEGVIDPKTNVVASNTILAQTLRSNLLQFQAELAALTKQKVGPNSPTFQILQSRINTTRDQLVTIEAQIGTPQDRARPLSGVVGEFEKLEMERTFAESQLTSSLQQLEQARMAAIAQHLYVTPFVQPSLPQSSTYPVRYWATLMVGFVAFLLWTIGLLVVRSIRDHLA